MDNNITENVDIKILKKKERSKKYYSNEEKTSLLAAVIKQKNIGNIIQQDVTSDGRMILCLEQRSKSIKIFY